MIREEDRTVGKLPFEGELGTVDPLMDRLINLEEERQGRRLIMIPSESMCHPIVRKVLESSYTNLYAEGYPSSLANSWDEEILSDTPAVLAHYRRYADRRFYKGTEFVNNVELLCQRRVSQAFANENAPAESIYSNVQPLSGAAANIAVQEAFLEPGDTFLGMDLMHGGHLSHGSEFHMSGKRYRAVSYGIDPDTHRLEYDEIEKIAMEEQPKLIIAGYSSYPWAPDWNRFREIADKCGAMLMADIAHPAGMVIAGVYPSPVGIADVTTFTTHKTLMGPRGAVILTTDREHAAAVDMAVFPGEQGGPHINTIAALAVAFKIAMTAEFKAVQRKMVEDCAYFGKALEKEGLDLGYGGTNTHLLLIDLKKLPRLTDEQLRGEMAVRILELCGIVANKNTVPGDTLTALATGVRMGTPWLTQRGVTHAQLDRLAKTISKILQSIYPFHYDGMLGVLPRGKIEYDVLKTMKREVAELVNELDDSQPVESTSQHYSVLPGSPVESAQAKGTRSGGSTVFFPAQAGLIRVKGARVEAHMQNLVTTDLETLGSGQARRTLMLDADGKLIDDVVVSRIRARDDRPDNGFFVIANPGRAREVLGWMRGHAEGYLVFDRDDVNAKVEGPVVVDDLAADCKTDGAEKVLIELRGPAAGDLADQCGVDGRVLKLEGEDVCYVITGNSAVEGGLLAAGAEKCSGQEREALCKAMGLPAAGSDAGKILKSGQKQWFDLGKPYFVGQRKLAGLVKVDAGKSFSFQEKNGELKRTPLYEEHAKRTNKLAPFAGWEMPIWYRSNLEEHKAVRETCALFDVAHMGVFEVSGEYAEDFLDLVTTNYARWIGDGESFYAYMLDPSGYILDDVMVYRVTRERFLVVVNAANEQQDWEWLNFVNSGEALLDPDNPHKRVLHPVTLRDLKDSQHGADCRVDIALQGPGSRDVLAKLVDRSEMSRLVLLNRTEVGEFTMAGIQVVLSRTGYTGEQMGFEMFVHPGKATELWRQIIGAGEEHGVLPAGLATRDSARTEAGLPLYGHEIEGHHKITPGGAGFSGYVKFHKPFFIGRKALLEREQAREKVVVRFAIGKGSRPIRTNDPIADEAGNFIGYVTSCVAVPGAGQAGLAYVSSTHNEPGKTMIIFAMPSKQRQEGIVAFKDLPAKTQGVKTVEVEISERFPARETESNVKAQERMLG